jgi:hypothetical protein
MTKASLLTGLLLASCFIMPSQAMADALPDVPKGEVLFSAASGFIVNTVLAQRKIPAKTSTETEEEYRKRLPADYPSDKEFSFVVRRSLLQVSYDPEQKEATYSAGPLDLSDAAPLQHPLPIAGIKVTSASTDDGEYQTTDASNAKIKVQKKTLTYSAFVFDNAQKFSPTFYNPQQKRIFFKIAATPARVEELNRTADLVITVHPLSPNRSLFATWFNKPKADNPVELTAQAFTMDVILVKVAFRDSATKQILAESTVPTK